MSLTKSHLFGLDALLDLGRTVWADVQRFLTEYGPAILLSAVLAAAYALLFWGLIRLALWLLSRFGPPDAHPVLRTTLRRVLRLTGLLLAAISVAGLFPLLTPYIPALFRGYLLLLLLYAGWALIHHLLHRQANAWGLDASLSLLLSNVVRGCGCSRASTSSSGSSASTCCRFWAGWAWWGWRWALPRRTFSPTSSAG
ncbi:hypothetical protein [Deinococcus radiodurans]|uniref:hypothetical protein n=1 Tax=Deinococcus radiodurans TaxID=1299 RepID=UPI001FB648E6|nr:hypothetical protein [Deinococcus radiodurans]